MITATVYTGRYVLHFTIKNTFYILKKYGNNQNCKSISKIPFYLMDLWKLKRRTEVCVREAVNSTAAPPRMGYPVSWNNRRGFKQALCNKPSPQVRHHSWLTAERVRWTVWTFLRSTLSLCGLCVITGM